VLRLTLAAVHLLALGIGLGALWARARSLGSRPLDTRSMRLAFTVDSWWGIAALLWIVSGVWRLVGGVEKTTGYYTHNYIFLTKMDLFAAIFLLELWPMITLIRWRNASRRMGDAWKPNEATAARFATISYVQVALIVAMVVAAVSMARGYGYRP
jgi:putative membrane protein